MSRFRVIVAAALAAAMAWLAGCGGGGGIGGTGAPEAGTMHVSLTDAPSCGYDAVNITVERVRVHKQEGAADSAADWHEVVLSPPKRFDLLSLTNGVLADLGSTPLPAGKYTQMRLVLAENTAANPFANSVVPTGGSETELSTPSASQSGLKLKVDIDIAPDRTTEVVIDFDACKSVVKRGNSGKYNLKPHLTVTAVLSNTGLRIDGYAHSAIALPTTNVSVQAGGVPLKATVPDASGRFVLYPVPVGSYELVVTAAGRATAVMTGVPVTDSAITTVSSLAVPILPPAATPRVVTGSVTPATATVRALQSFSGGPTIEAAWGPVDATIGAFAFALPIQAPARTAYVANPSALVFVADNAAAAKYTLEARSGAATQTLAIDVSALVPPVTFIFP